MAKAAHSGDLRAAFQKHHRETEGQVQRLEKVFQLIEEPAKGKKCAAIEGIIEEGQEIMEEYKGNPALDAGLLAAAQAVEHYEISRYGTLKAWAEKLKLPQAAKLLDQTLSEEKNTDEALSELAEAAVNQEAEAAE
jgi:ferritin-like metal-binding protein YciE